MNIDTQDFLWLCEQTKKLVFFDLEMTGFNADYNSILCAGLKPYGQPPQTFFVEQAGNDQKVARLATEYLQDMHCWVTFYGKGFDIPFLRGRLLKWKRPDIIKKPHLDMYWIFKSSIKLSRKSQAHILSWLETDEKKQAVSPAVWNRILYDFDAVKAEMTSRCESDVTGLEA